jgi:hypothetical protein
MNSLLRSFLLVLLSVGLLQGCKKDSDTPTGLAGTWKLTDRQCFCPRTPMPNETVVFTNTEFTFYREGQRTVYGTYSYGTGSICGVGTATPVLRFAYANPNSTLQAATSTVTGNTLVLDYGGPCDAPVNTYKRVL